MKTIVCYQSLENLSERTQFVKQRWIIFRNFIKENVCDQALPLANIPEQWKHQSNVGNKLKKLTAKTPQRGQRHCFGTFFAILGKVSRIALMLLSRFLNNNGSLSRLTTRPFKKLSSIFGAALYRKVLGLIFYFNFSKFYEVYRNCCSSNFVPYLLKRQI